MWTLVKIVAIAVPLILGVAYLTLAERKVIGWMQVRIGPNRVGPLGLLQPFADVFKLVFKEIIVPTGANRYLFFIAPMLALAPGARRVGGRSRSPTRSCCPNINAGLLYILAMTSIGVYGIILAGWASNSKYAFLGCLRSAAQIVSLRDRDGLRAGRRADGGEQPQPVATSCAARRAAPRTGTSGRCFPLFVVYLVSGIAETNRHPFDVAEGESEIVAGFHVEYSGVDVRAVLPRRVHEHDPDRGADVDHVPRRLAVAVAAC